MGERTVAHKFLDALLYTHVHKTELLGPLVPQADSRGFSIESPALKLVKVSQHQSLGFIFSVYFDEESLDYKFILFTSRRKEDKERLCINTRPCVPLLYRGSVILLEGAPKLWYYT